MQQPDINTRSSIRIYHISRCNHLDYFCFKKEEDKEFISHDMSSSSKFSHHDYPRRRWLIPLWILLLLLHHHTFACFDSISTPLQDLFFNSHVSVFIYYSILSKLFFLFFFLSYMIIDVIFSFYILLRRRCRL